MAAVQHRATTRTSNTDNSTTKTKSKATSARKSPATKRKRVSAETARAAAALKGLAVEAPAPSIEANEPGQFGRINVMDITPAEERGIFPARVELGEPFEMTAQVFIEGRTKVGVTAIVRNPRGKETMRRAMTCVNPGLDRWTVMVKCGEHSDLKPWEDGYAAVKRQLGEWTVTIEGWEDAYVSWLHDARIKVRVMDDVDNALNSGAELLARWAETPDTGLTARDRKTLEKAAETMADQTLSARIVSPPATTRPSPPCTRLTRCATASPPASPSASRWNAQSPASRLGTSSSRVPKAPPSIRTPARSFRVR